MASGQKKFLGRDTYTSVINNCVSDFLDFYDKQNVKMNPAEIERRLTTQLNDEIMEHNATCANDRWTKLHCLPADIVARVINHCEIVKNISLTPDEQDNTTLLGIYTDKGKFAGTYVTDERYIKKLIMSYSRLKTYKEVGDVVSYLKDIADVVEISRNGNLSIVNNGIYNRKTKSLEPFRSDYIALRKIGTDYNPNVSLPQIVMDDGVVWTPDWQLDSFSDDPEIRKLLRDILTCAVYPHHKWDKAFFPYSTVGNNGKGTYAALIRAMLGESGWVSISLKDFANDFMCSKLIGNNVVITDENDVATYVDSAANFKSAITQDPINLNRKYKEPITLKWMGFMLQCVNDFPKFRDRTPSMLRRLVIIPFEKSFKGCERKYIREDYLKRKEVREYFLKMALENDITDIDIPSSCQAALDDYQQSSNPVYDFYKSEVCSYSAWKFYPLAFVYEHYKAWYKENYPSGKPLSSVNFKQELHDIIIGERNPMFKEICIENISKKVPKDSMANIEPNILKYALEKYMDKTYHGTDPDKICNFKRPEVCKGYILLS